MKALVCVSVKLLQPIWQITYVECRLKVLIIAWFIQNIAKDLSDCPEAVQLPEYRLLVENAARAMETYLMWKKKESEIMDLVLYLLMRACVYVCMCTK